MALPTPEFLDSDVNGIVTDMILFYESATGKTLEPAQPERLLINNFAYRIALRLRATNDASLQNLLQFSTFPVLDYLVELVGVVRIPAKTSKTTLEFNILTGHPPLTIPAGTRVSNSDGTAVVATIAGFFVGSGIDTVEVPAESVTPGINYNGFLANSLTTIIDTFPQFDSVSNIDQTSSGSDEETDEQLRERSKLAPSAFSVAGPVDAYKYFTYSVNPDIIDVSVISHIPGQVNIYPLTNTVPTPPAIINQVKTFFNNDKVRPLTDTIVVLAPTTLNYTIQVDLTLYDGSDDVAIVQQVNDNLSAYVDEKGSKLGIDIITKQIIEACMVEGVYDLVLALPASNIVVGASEFGNCTSITVTVVGYNQG